MIHRGCSYSLPGLDIIVTVLNIIYRDHKGYAKMKLNVSHKRIMANYGTKYYKIKKELVEFWEEV